MSGDRKIPLIDDPTTEVAEPEAERIVPRGPLSAPYILDPPTEDLSTSGLFGPIVLPPEPEDEARPPMPARIDGIVVARLVALEGALACVDFPGNWAGQPLAARSLTPLDASHVGREVAVAFELGRPEAPIVTGVIQTLPQKPA
jgi:hypothetical protein